MISLLGISKGISYNSLERLYPDPLVIMILNNLFMNSLKKKGISSVDSSGEETGYSKTVTKHYRYIRERNGKDIKEGKFVYSFVSWTLQQGCMLVTLFLLDLKRMLIISY